MIYEYNPKVVNTSDYFFDDKNFVGYILPDGSIYKCKDHNISNVSTFLMMFLKLLDMDYENRNEILNASTNDKLAKVIINKIKRMSHDEIHALLVLLESEIILSDIIVGFFNCHMITRMKKTIITSELNHRCFYNYLLHDFKVYTIPKIIYDDINKKYQCISGIDRNSYLYDEINTIKSEIRDNEIELFTK